VPIIDIPADFGRYAIGALNHGVETVIASSQYITPLEMAEQYSMGMTARILSAKSHSLIVLRPSTFTSRLRGAVTGQTIAFVQVPDDQMYNALKSAGDNFATTLVAIRGVGVGKA
jgi:hypothetical protein